MPVYSKEDLYFLPQDFENIITREDLEKALIDIILKIRAAENKGKFFQIKEKIKELKEKYRYGDYDGGASVITMLNIYHRVIEISLELRKLLKEFFPSMDIYDHINYSFYINGKRYFTEKINTNWVSKSKENDLMLNLTKVRDSLQSQYQQGITQKIRDIFNEHYNSYLNMIIGTYRGEIGTQKASLKYGHVAEAFEEHLFEHHNPEIIQLLNQTRSFKKDDPIILKIQNKEKELSGYWENHESVESGWMHIRASLGKMRGTVAGDVFNMQVKQTKENNGSVQLASLETLKDGVFNYCDIINEDKSPKEIVQTLVTYMSETVDKKAYVELARIGNDIFKEKISDGNILIHI